MSRSSTSPPRQTAGYAPLRRPHSMRRTSSMDVSWPNGREANMRFDGRARDIATGSASSSIDILAEDTLIAGISNERIITKLTTTPERRGTEKLIGEKGGNNLRKALVHVLPEERAQGTPLYLLLDDIAGTSLIAGWAWSNWMPDWAEQMKEVKRTQSFTMEGVCIGFRPGSSALDFDSSFDALAQSPTPELYHPNDIEGWHRLDKQAGVGLRRARRIDVWLEGDTIKIDSAFQDSGTTPDEQRLVLHEYHLQAEASLISGKIINLHAIPCVLPFPECIAAPDNMSRLLGVEIDKLRDQVLVSLAKTAGCTHLNDALRALAEVPLLAQQLVRQQS